VAALRPIHRKFAAQLFFKYKSVRLSKHDADLYKSNLRTLRISTQEYLNLLDQL
jgi:hypothetical protein